MSPVRTRSPAQILFLNFPHFFIIGFLRLSLRNEQWISLLILFLSQSQKRDYIQGKLIYSSMNVVAANVINTVQRSTITDRTDLKLKQLWR